LEYAYRRAEEEGCERIHVWPVAKRDHAVLCDLSGFEAPSDGMTYDLPSSRQPSPR
jgi:hypothetical protein